MTQARILVIKHGALGDLIQGFDAYAGLRAGHPDAHIALLTSFRISVFSHRAILVPQTCAPALYCDCRRIIIIRILACGADFAVDSASAAAAACPQ